MTHSMKRLLTTGADSQRRVDSQQAVMEYLVSVSCEPAGGLYPSESCRSFSAQESRPPEKQQQASLVWTKDGKNEELGHGEVVSVCDCSRLEPLPDESRSFRFHQGPEVPDALV